MTSKKAIFIILTLFIVIIVIFIILFFLKGAITATSDGMNNNSIDNIINDEQKYIDIMKDIDKESYDKKDTAEKEKIFNMIKNKDVELIVESGYSQGELDIIANPTFISKENEEVINKKNYTQSELNDIANSK